MTVNGIETAFIARVGTEPELKVKPGRQTLDQPQRLRRRRRRSAVGQARCVRRRLPATAATGKCCQTTKSCDDDGHDGRATA
jgi:hypothetical protein